MHALVAAAIALVSASLATLLLAHATGHMYMKGLVPLLDLDGERNLPTVFSVSLLLLAAWQMVQVARSLRSRPRPGELGPWPWAWLALAFLYVALDEGLMFHERLNVPVREWLGREQAGAFYFAWVLPALLLVGLAAAASAWTLRRLPRPLARSMLLAAVLYVGGGLGLELVGGSWAERQGTGGLGYGLLVNAEESLELAGVLVLLGGLGRYRQQLDRVAGTGRPR